MKKSNCPDGEPHIFERHLRCVLCGETQKLKPTNDLLKAFGVVVVVATMLGFSAVINSLERCEVVCQYGYTPSADTTLDIEDCRCP